MTARRKPTKDLVWDAYIRAAHEAVQSLPDDVRKTLLRISTEVCDLGDELQVPPRQMAAGVASLIGILALVDVNGDIHDNDGIDAFVAYAHAAMHVAVASARLAGGWKPR
jgi:hypothetical protein